MLTLNKKILVSFPVIGGVYCLFLAYLLFSSTAFFDWDEWSILLGLVSNTYVDWLMQPHMGQVFPVGKILYFIELNIFSLNYNYYLLVNVILHFFTSLLLYKLLRLMKSGELPSTLICLLYCFHPAHFENLFWGMQVALIFGAMTLLLSFVTSLYYLRRGDNIYLVILCFLLILSAFSFAFSLLSPIYCLTFVFLGRSGGAGRAKKLIVVLLLVQSAITYLWLLAPYLFTSVQPHPGAATGLDISLTLAQMTSSIIYITNGLIGSVAYFLSALSFKLSLNFVYLCILISIFLTLFLIARKLPDGRRVIISMSAVCLFVLIPMIGLLSLTRAHSLETIFQPRYYHYLGIPIAMIIMFPLSKFISSRSIKWHGAVLLVFAGLYSIMFYEGRSYLSDDFYRSKRGAEVISRFNSFQVEDGDMKSLWMPATNPELTKEQLQQIKVFIK